MSVLQEGDIVRYTEEFCAQTSTTRAGYVTKASRRGKVILVSEDGARCSVDWGDFIMEFRRDTSSLVVVPGLIYHTLLA